MTKRICFEFRVVSFLNNYFFKFKLFFTRNIMMMIITLLDSLIVTVEYFVFYCMSFIRRRLVLLKILYFIRYLIVILNDVQTQ